MTTFYPTLNWRDVALRLARAIEEGDLDAMADAAKDARLFERVPCPSITLGGPDNGKIASAGQLEPWEECDLCGHSLGGHGDPAARGDTSCSVCRDGVCVVPRREQEDAAHG